ncbi:MAG: DUF3800 domain-containing protein [bacterium]|nr:DUF3800 domain-containing protein [bacterium]
MNNPVFCFMDESGVLADDPNQPFFAMGAVMIEDTSRLVQDLESLKRQALNSTGWKGKGFEFKFKALTRQYRPYFERFIDLALSHAIRVSIVILKKEEKKRKFDKGSNQLWESYIDYSKHLIKKNTDIENPCIIVADYFSKPRRSTKFLELELKTIPGVVNAVMLESEACSLIQIADVLTGCVSYHFRRARSPQSIFDKEKCGLSDFLATKLRRPTLSEDFLVKQPVQFQVSILRN